MHLDKPEGQPDDKVAWASDVAAQMLRRFGFPYVSLNPGASYRGLHDSIVNHLGNVDPGMILCLHEDHAIGIAHGYAKATGKPMAAIVHSNVGLMHGMMGIYNAFCDRMPVFIRGATGPVDAHQRRPWIDWIHTSADQGGMVRDIVKFDNQPSSPEAIIDAMLRANIMMRTEPCGPTYICFDAGLQESSLDKEITFPDLARFQPPVPPRPAREDVARAVAMIKAAKRPVILFGRGTHSSEDWNKRVQLAEYLGACVMTDLKTGAVFPTDHPAHVVEPFNQLGKTAREILGEADLVLALEWVDLAGALHPPKGGPKVTAKVIYSSLDQAVHNGAHMIFQATPTADLYMAAGAEAVVSDLLEALGPGAKKEPWRAAVRRTPKPVNPDRITVESIASTLRASVKDHDNVSLAALCRGWPCDAWPFHNSSAYLGKDGGGGIGSGGALSIGAALGNLSLGKKTISILGDGDFMMGGNAIWTAVKHKIPLMIIINNNQSYFNDELHQEVVAKRRNRPVGNRWIGQAISGPGLDIAKFVEAQGAVGIGPIKTQAQLQAAITRGLEILDAGGVCLLDVHVPPDEDRRDASSTGVRNT